MNGLSKFSRSWLLFKSSLLIVVRNKRLLVFPIVISVLMLVIFLFFFAPVVLWPTGHAYTSGEHWKTLANTLLTQSSDAAGRHGSYTGLSPVAMAYLAFIYFVSMFFATFFNVAFYNEILAGLSGQTVSLSRGFKFACTRWKAILMWALFAGIVGLIIKAIEQRFALVGQLIARLIGLAWSIAAVFVIPVIVREEASVNPVGMLRKSAGILKNTWGEALIGYVGLAFGNMLVVLGSLGVLVGAAVLSSALNNFWILGVAAAVWVVFIFAWSYLMNVAGLVYKGALYLYAAEGIIAEPYDRELLDSAWKFKKG